MTQSDNSAGTGADTRQRPEQDQTAAVARQMAQAAANINAKREAEHTGPPPSFEVSLLEMESDLKQVIARMEQSRAQKANQEAIQTEAESARHAREAAQAKEPDMVQEAKPEDFSATVSETTRNAREAGTTSQVALEAPEPGSLSSNASATVEQTTKQAQEAGTQSSAALEAPEAGSLSSNASATVAETAQAMVDDSAA